MYKATLSDFFNIIINSLYYIMHKCSQFLLSFRLMNGKLEEIYAMLWCKNLYSMKIWCPSGREEKITQIKGIWMCSYESEFSWLHIASFLSSKISLFLQYRFVVGFGNMRFKGKPSEECMNVTVISPAVHGDRCNMPLLVRFVLAPANGSSSWRMPEICTASICSILTAPSLSVFPNPCCFFAAPSALSWHVTLFSVPLTLSRAFFKCSFAGLKLRLQFNEI